MTPPTSTLIQKRPDGSEYRVCGCGDHYTLPVPYDQANIEIRDKCPVCISCMQREEFERREGKP